MVSKRQKLARKKFKQEHPELFPKPEPTPPKDPNKKKKKKKGTDFKKIKKSPFDPRKSKGSFSSKHPLRVPGMKPGDTCFICKGADHIARDCPKKAEWDRHKICLLCRQRGHSIKNCPDKDEKSIDQKLCYNCGERGHSLSQCPKPLENGGTKFASCFVCNEQGHLSKDCPKNPHGIYPKGGSCKICGGVTHLAKDCPDKGNRNSNISNGIGRSSSRYDDMPRGKVTKLVSGDDLEDDFMTIDYTAKISKEPSKESNSSDIKGDVVKPKKKQGPKVVNFMG